MGVRKLNAAGKRRTKLGLALEQSAKEILAHVKGDGSCLDGASFCRTKSM